MMDRYDLGGEIIDEMNEKICWLESRADQLREGDFDELLCVLLDYESENCDEEWDALEDVFRHTLKHPRVERMLEKAIEYQAEEDFNRMMKAE